MPTEPALLVHSARAIDARGDTRDTWLTVDSAGRIEHRGVGASWRERAAASVVDAAGRVLSPGLIDAHCHGALGAAFDDPAADVRAALDFHARSGSTSLVASLVSAPLERLEQRLAALAAIEHPAFAGSHLEGPFLAERHRGAHDAAALREPDAAAVARLLAAAGGRLRQLTLAPELPGALEAIAACRDAGVRVAIGHTAADYATAAAGFAAGASLLTHAFNGMPGLLQRAPGPIAAALEAPGVVLELILDGVHVHDAMVRLLFRLAPDRIALVSDAMAAAGLGDGEYRLGELAVSVHLGVARLQQGGSLAGSTGTLAAAVRRAILETGIAPAVAIAAASATPARALGLDPDRGLLEPGLRADLVLFEPDWSVGRVWLAGRELSA